MIKVKFKKLSNTAQTPTKGSALAAAYDLYLSENCLVPAHSRAIGKTDIAVELPSGYCADIRPRSGFSAKGMEGFLARHDEITNEGLSRFNADVLLGLLDEDYRNGIGILISSHDDRDFYITKGTRIAQLFVKPYENVAWVEAEDLSDTDRGLGGFGSSGTR